MTKVELHVFEQGGSQCLSQYVNELVRSRSRYCQLCLCVDGADQAVQWRSELRDFPSVEVFDQDAEMPQLPFQAEMLLSLSAQVSPLFSAFKQTIDVVIDTESAREQGRLRYRFYRDRGYPLRHIKVQNQEAVT